MNKTSKKQECICKCGNIREASIEHLAGSKVPNKKTLKAITDTQAGKGLIKAKDAEDLFKKLGI